MIEFMEISKQELRALLNQFYLSDLKKVLNYIIKNFTKEDREILALPDMMYNKNKYFNFNKAFVINIFIKIKESLHLTQSFANLLTKTEASRHIYFELIWKMNYLDSKQTAQKYNIKLKEIENKDYYREVYLLEDELGLVERRIYCGYNTKKDTFQFIADNIDNLLKFFYPLPDDYKIKAVSEPSDTMYHYNNEDSVLPFIQNLKEMLDNNLIVFGKTNEKPMAKSLNLLKSSNMIEEFYQEKKLDTLALDMLTRSFYYYDKRFEFKDEELSSLKVFIEHQLKDWFSFSISRIFVSHLKKIRFGGYVNGEKELFDTFKYLMTQMPKEGWVNFENILNHTYYRDLYFDFENRYKTESYTFLSDQKDKYGNENKILEVGDYHGELFHEPVLKGLFFYMGALGLFELKYNKPTTPHENLKAKDRAYISIWDGLQYIKLTKLGEYIFGFNKSYTPKKIAIQKVVNVKFDEFKPIITVDKTDTLLIAKLESYTDKLENQRYILSYSKLFRDCKSLKALKLKIDGFYKNIEEHPPKVFKEFFDEVIENSNLMKRNLKQVVIELKNNKKLLNLFMTNHKLQELLIKAEGYRIIVFKEDISKVTKIVKDNGFFLEF